MIREYTKSYFEELKKTLDEVSLENIEKIAQVIFNAYLDDKQIFIIGNGGSAATASHFACDLNKGTLGHIPNEKVKRFKAHSLTDNVSTMTAWANDTNYNEIFSQQLKNLLNQGDILIAISASGNSLNIIKAVEMAKSIKANVIGLTGFDGGKLDQMADISVVAKVNKYDISEDIHLMLTHIITRYFCDKLNEQ